MSGVHNLEQAETNGTKEITNEDLKEAGRGPMAGDTSGGNETSKSDDK